MNWNISLHPPIAILPDLARVLKVSIEHLLGITAIKDATLTKDKRLMRRLYLLEQLLAKDQRTVMALIKSLYSSKNKLSA